MLWINCDNHYYYLIHLQCKRFWKKNHTRSKILSISLRCLFFPVPSHLIIYCFVNFSIIRQFAIGQSDNKLMWRGDKQWQRRKLWFSKYHWTQSVLNREWRPRFWWTVQCNFTIQMWTKHCAKYKIWWCFTTVDSIGLNGFFFVFFFWMCNAFFDSYS